MNAYSLAAVALLVLLAVPPGAADPVTWTIGPSHIGLWVEGTTTNNHPTNLTVDRSDGATNVLHWNAPTFNDGRTLTGFVMYRVHVTGPLDPLEHVQVSTPTVTTLMDPTADFDGVYIYFVTAIFEDSEGTVTESLPSTPVVARPVANGYPTCDPATVNLGQAPFVFLHTECL